MKLTVDRASLARHTAARHTAALAVARWRLPEEAEDALHQPMPQARWLELTQERFLAWLRHGGFAQSGGSAQSFAEEETKTAARGRRFPVPSQDSYEEL
ncbi:hypothetical protein [Massilia endophytica]|uniref:hypothetical protein n=1 Tax=Massilia endophytica TaxID=2899220 RepID=UPI001E5B2A8E|nr:hypothetical protein [Massilia endophytica]UGQ45247.1 hypothetical protein LSQ66_15770 [Massilia endophytica]